MVRGSSGDEPRRRPVSASACFPPSTWPTGTAVPGCNTGIADVEMLPAALHESRFLPYVQALHGWQQRLHRVTELDITSRRARQEPAMSLRRQRLWHQRRKLELSSHLMSANGWKPDLPHKQSRKIADFCKNNKNDTFKRRRRSLRSRLDGDCHRVRGIVAAGVRGTWVANWHQGALFRRRGHVTCSSSNWPLR